MIEHRYAGGKERQIVWRQHEYDADYVAQTHYKYVRPFFDVLACHCVVDAARDNEEEQEEPYVYEQMYYELRRERLDRQHVQPEIGVEKIVRETEARIARKYGQQRQQYRFCQILGFNCQTNAI